MKKVLIIEDDKDLSETLTMFLESNKFSIHTAYDGIQGVQEAMRIFPDIIICDISMPNLDGYGVYDTIKHINSTAFIPFIFLTAKADPQEIRKGMNLGADDYITKPFKNSDLLEAINVRLKKAEGLSMMSDKKLLTVLENPINGIFICQNKKIIYANNKLAYILGYQTHELTELFIEDFINRIIKQKDREKILNYFQKASGKTVTLDITRIKALKKTKEDINIDLFIKSFSFNEKETLIGYVIDITNTLEDNEDTSISKKPTTGIVSSREQEVLILICQGLVNKEIAEKLAISKRTVDRHRDNLMKKTNSRNTAELIMNAIKFGLVEL